MEASSFWSRTIKHCFLFFRLRPFLNWRPKDHKDGQLRRWLTTTKFVASQRTSTEMVMACLDCQWARSDIWPNCSRNWFKSIIHSNWNALKQQSGPAKSPQKWSRICKINPPYVGKMTRYFCNATVFHALWFRSHYTHACFHCYTGYIGE